MATNPADWAPADAIRAVAMEAAAATAPPEKRPLYRPLPPAPMYPVDALGPLAPAAIAIYECTQAPMAIAAQSVLAAATLAVQAQRNVTLPGGGEKPLTGLFVSVAESGERKSSVDRIALAGVYQVEEEWRQQSEGERKSYINRKAAWDTARDHAKKTTKGDMVALMATFERIGAEPLSPPHPLLLVSDATPEGLVLHLADGRPFAGVFTAEGGMLIGGAAFNDESQMRTAALFNSLWDGEPIRRRRVGTGITFLPGRRCSTHIMLQPVVADRLFGNSMLDGVGMIARVLLVAPDTTAGTRLYREPPAGNRAILDDYNGRLRHLLKRPLVTKFDAPDVLAPPAMRLHPNAASEWIKFHDSCERAIAVDAPLASIRAFGAKLAEHAGRLAAVLMLYADPDAMEVSLEAMQAGIALATHYANEMLRLQGGASIAPELRLAQRLLLWWRELPNPTAHLAFIYQRGPAAMRDAKTARKAAETLEEHGWIERLQPGTPLDGTPRRVAWRLIP